MTMVFAPSAPTFLKTSDDRDFPVRRVFCIGRNYEAHAREMGKDPKRDLPFFFTKWAETVVNAGPADDCKIAYPSETQNFHHEAELVVAIGKEASNITESQSTDVIWGYAVGLDMTRRDLQLEARDKGRPWDTGKNVEQSSPASRLVPAKDCGHISSGEIRLTVNGEERQKADISDLIWSVDEIVAYVTRFYTLQPGDLIYTGTPAGVGAVLPGDRIVCTIAGLPHLDVTIGK